MADDRREGKAMTLAMAQEFSDLRFLNEVQARQARTPDLRPPGPLVFAATILTMGQNGISWDFMGVNGI